MNVTTLDLLPQHSESILSCRAVKLKILNFIQVLYKELIEGINAFIEEKYYMFDAQVGETSCQIRAYKILLLSTASTIAPVKQSLKSKISEADDCLHKCQSFIAYFEQAMLSKGFAFNRLLDQQISIYSFLKENQLILSLTSEIIYLVKCYILTKYSTRDNYGIPIAINYQNLKTKFAISQTQAKRLIHFYQKNIALDSCEFIFKIIDDLEPTYHLKYILPALKKTAEEERSVLPCFQSTESILDHALKYQMAVMIVTERYQEQEHLDTLCLLFLPFNGKFVYRSPNLYMGKYLSVIVVKGVTIYQSTIEIESMDEYINRFNKVGLKKVILYNMAVHPQYVGERLSWLAENPFQIFHNDVLLKIDRTEISALEQELHNAKTFARISGCCREKPSLFFVKHIYCNILENQLAQINRSNYNKGNKINQVHKHMPSRRNDLVIEV